MNMLINEYTFCFQWYPRLMLMIVEKMVLMLWMAMIYGF